MKQFKFLLVGLLALSLGFFNSCKNDDDDDDVTASTPKPTVEVAIMKGSATGNEVGDTVDIKITITSSKDLIDLKIDAAQGHDGYLGSEVISVSGDENELGDMFKNGYNNDNTSFTGDFKNGKKYAVIDYRYIIRGDETASSISLDITVKAEDSDVAYKTQTIGIGTPAPDINTYTGIVLGSLTFNTTDPSYYSTSNDTKYKFDANGAENSDFGYSYGSANEATICSPSWSEIKDLNQGTSGWSSRKLTKFKSTSLTIAEFDAITTGAEIVTEASGADVDYVNHLQVGTGVQVIAFTEGVNKGLIAIKSISGTGSGTITLDVKVQK